MHSSSLPPGSDTDADTSITAISCHLQSGFLSSSDLFFFPFPFPCLTFPLLLKHSPLKTSEKKNSVLVCATTLPTYHRHRRPDHFKGSIVGATAPQGAPGARNGGPLQPLSAEAQRVPGQAAAISQPKPLPLPFR